ncbi:ribonuclease Z [candidate division KSB1 bacterium]|nr:ribonuclease Z [candidate division KSB1 bacterium]
MNDQVYIHFLGTGASVPSLKRGLPAAVIMKDQTGILLDCGEGTQLKLLQAGISAAKIRYIVLSHLHGDHLFGLPGFLTSQQMFQRIHPLTLYAPVGIRSFMDCLMQITGFNPTFPFELVELPADESGSLNFNQFDISYRPLDHKSPCLGYHFKEHNKPGKFDAERAEQLGIPHGPERSRLHNGEAVELEDGRIIEPEQVVESPIPGRTISYCTDTRPCDATVELARGSQILIHDATFTEMHKDRAFPTGHSTAVQAAMIAKNANVEKLYLWHLSMRLDKQGEEQSLSEARSVFPESFIAQDLDSICLNRPQ